MLMHLARGLRARRPSPTRRPVRPRPEALEERLALSWYGAPPSAIAPPTNAVPVTLDAQGDASGNASIAANENDYYSFVAPTSGPYRINALTPSSNLDTVLGRLLRVGHPARLQRRHLVLEHRQPGHREPHGRQSVLLRRHELRGDGGRLLHLAGRRAEPSRSSTTASRTTTAPTSPRTSAP